MSGAPKDTTLARRLRAGLGVALLTGLSLVALVLVLRLSEASAFRLRVDLSEVGRNSLDPTTVDLLGRLEDPVVAHCFFRAEGSPLDRPVAEAQARYLDLFLVARGLAPGRFDFVVHDLSDVTAAAEELRARGLDRVNAVVFEAGSPDDATGVRRSVLPVDASSLDIVQESAEPPRFRLRDLFAEEEVQRALLKLSLENRKRVLVATGHGERDALDEDALGMSLLGQALAGDGFDLAAWNPLENGPVGDDVDILLVAAPRDAYSEDEVVMVHDFVARGGRLLVIAGQDLYAGPGSTGDLLAPYGMLARSGVVSVPTFSQDLGGVSVGFPKVADFFVREAGLNSTHEITRPIWEAALRVRMAYARAFERGVAPPGGSLQALLTQNDRATWRDLPLDRTGAHDPLAGRHDWVLTPGREEAGPQVLAMAAEFPVEGAEGLALDDPRRRARVVGIGMSAMGSNADFGAGSTANRDLLRNAFAWLAEREFSLRVELRRDEGAVLDVYRGTEVITLRRFAWYGLPGVLALVGLVLAWRRRS